MLLAGSSMRAFAANVSSFAADLNWSRIGYAAALLIGLRIAFWIFFRPAR